MFNRARSNQDPNEDYKDGGHGENREVGIERERFIVKLNWLLLLMRHSFNLLFYLMSGRLFATAVRKAADRAKRCLRCIAD